jgi:hypothetical protein
MGLFFVKFGLVIKQMNLKKKLQKILIMSDWLNLTQVDLIHQKFSCFVMVLNHNIEINLIKFLTNLFVY